MLQDHMHDKKSVGSIIMTESLTYSMKLYTLACAWSSMHASHTLISLKRNIDLS